MGHLIYQELKSDPGTRLFAFWLLFVLMRVSISVLTESFIRNDLLFPCWHELST